MHKTAILEHLYGHFTFAMLLNGQNSKKIVPNFESQESAILSIFMPVMLENIPERNSVPLC